jgi:branched-chain amino acid transport system substrate-binding protein
VVVGALLAALSLVACSDDDGNSQGSQPQQISLAVVQTLSGPSGVYGQSGIEGIELAIKEIEAAYPKVQIEYTIADDKGSIDEGVSVYHDLVQQKPVAIIGPSLSNVGFRVLPIADAASVPAVSPMTTASGIAAIGEYVFRVALAEEASLPALVGYVSQQSRIDEAVLIYDSSDAYNRSAADAMRKGIAMINARVSVEIDLAGSPDLTQALADERVRSADVILLPLLVDHVGAVLHAIRDAGLQQPVLGGEALATLDVVAQAGAAAEGMYVSSTWHPDFDKASSKQFVAAYQAAYGKQPEHFAAESYTSVYLLVDAVRRAGSTDPAAVQSALAATRDLDTILGQLSMSPEGDAVFQPVFQRFQNGQLTIAQ